MVDLLTANKGRITEHGLQKVSGGLDTIKTGSLSGTSVTLSSIPNYYGQLILQITGWSQDTNTARLLVRIGHGSGDSTAANYVGQNISGTSITNFTTNASASVTDGTTQTTGQTGSATVVIDGYQGGPHKRFHSRVLANTTETQSIGTYIGATTDIDTIVIASSAAGSFDAGTYTLYGVK